VKKGSFLTRGDTGDKEGEEWGKEGVVEAKWEKREASGGEKDKSREKCGERRETRTGGTGTQAHPRETEAGCPEQVSR